MNVEKHSIGERLAGRPRFSWLRHLIADANAGLKLASTARSYASEAELVLGNVIDRANQRHHTEMMDIFKKWTEPAKNLRGCAFVAILAEEMCSLNGQPFGAEAKHNVMLAGACGELSDDLIDDRGSEASTLCVLRKCEPTDSGSVIELFHLWNNALIAGVERLRGDFVSSHSWLIDGYNTAQADSKILDHPMPHEHISNARLRDVKDRTGGYIALLVRAIAMPHLEPAFDIEESYDPTNAPSTKQQAIYNLGCLLSRIDDMWDRAEDQEHHRMSLATRGLIGWKELELETAQVLNGLRQHYAGTASLDAIVRLNANRLVAYARRLLI